MCFLVKFPLNVVCCWWWQTFPCHSPFSRFLCTNGKLHGRQVDEAHLKNDKLQISHTVFSAGKTHHHSEKHSIPFSELHHQSLSNQQNIALTFLFWNTTLHLRHENNFPITRWSAEWIPRQCLPQHSYIGFVVSDLIKWRGRWCLWIWLIYSSIPRKAGRGSRSHIYWEIQRYFFAFTFFES